MPKPTAARRGVPGIEIDRPARTTRTRSLAADYVEITASRYTSASREIELPTLPAIACVDVDRAAKTRARVARRNLHIASRSRAKGCASIDLHGAAC